MNHKLFIIFKLLLVSSIVFLIVVTKTFISKDEGKLEISFEKLNDKLEGQNIFFIDTVRMKKRFKERPFTARQACAVESAGKLKFH